MQGEKRYPRAVLDWSCFSGDDVFPSGTEQSWVVHSWTSVREETGKVAAESVIKRGSVLHTSAPSLSEAKPEPGSGKG